MISRQPSLWMAVLIVLPDVILIRREDPSTGFGHIDLQNAQTRSMTRSMADLQSLSNLQETTRERLPIDFEVEVVGKIDAEIGLGGHAIEGVLQLRLMNINRNIRAAEVLQASSVIEMQMPHYDRLDVFDVVACFGYGSGELMVFCVVHAGEDVVEWSTPDCRVVFAGASFEKDEAFGRVVDQNGDHGKLAALALWILAAEGTGVSLKGRISSVLSWHDTYYGPLASSSPYLPQDFLGGATIHIL